VSKFYKIYDNIFPNPLVDSIYNKIFINRDLNWRYGGNIAGPEEKQSFPGMIHGFHNAEDPNNRKSGENADYFNHYLHYFCSKVGMQIHTILAGRLFMNFPLIKGNEKKYMHLDLHHPHWVAIYYLNDVDGDTVLYEDDEKTEICRVSPKKGRIVLFNGLIPHTGSYPTLDTRAIINYNFLGEFYG